MTEPTKKSFWGRVWEFSRGRTIQRQSAEPSLIKSITTAQTTPAWLSGKTLANPWSTDKAVREGYAASTWVFACVRFRMNAAASVVPVVKVKHADGTYKPAPDHPLQALINRPNPYTSFNLFMKQISSGLDLGGNAFWTKTRVSNKPNIGGKNPPKELWHIPADGVRVVPDDKEFIKEYSYKKGAQVLPIKPTDMIHLFYPDPANLYWGIAPLRAAGQTVDTEIEAVRFGRVSLQNRAVSDGAFVVPDELSDEQYADLKAKIKEQHQGVNGARTPWILDGGAKWEPFSMTPAELDYINSRKFSREEICSVFQVPPPIIGIYDNSTLNNIKTARRIFWFDGMLTFVDDVFDSLDASLSPEFGEGVWLTYEVMHIDVFIEAMMDKVDSADKLWKMGVPFNDVNERLQLGFKARPDGEVSYIPASVTPASITSGDGLDGNL